MIKLTIPGTPPSLNVWSRMHWSKAAKIKKQWENDIWVCAYKAMAHTNKSKIPYGKAKVKLTYYFSSNRRRDIDNINQKFVLDGLVKAGVIADDSAKVIGQVEVIPEYDKVCSRVEIEVTEVSLLVDQPYVD